MLPSILEISCRSKMIAGIAAVCFVVHSVRCLHYVLLFVFRFSKFEHNFLLAVLAIHAFRLLLCDAW